MAPPKNKTQKMSLGDFLGDQSLGSWADEMEDMPVASDSRTGYGDRRAFSSNQGYGGDRGFGDRGDRGYHREQLPLPTKPPYTAHLGNLSFDATENDIHAFFEGCAVTNVRIVEDKMERKPKGFGYVEFATLDGLKKALELGGTQFQGRNIRINVAEPPKDRPEGRELNDWTRKGPLPDLPSGSSGRRASDKGGYRNFDAASDAGSERGDRRRNFEGDGKSRDFGNWERKGPLSPLPPTGPAPSREGGRVRNQDGPRGDRRQSPAWGEGRRDGPRREFQERPPPERQPTASELDNQWRARMKPDAPARSPLPTPDTSAPSSPAGPPAAAAAVAAPAVRPKLNLAKRTVSEAEPSPSSTTGDSRSSPFGAARPIDTAAREKEVEEKRELALRQKKDAEEKVREEKKAKEAATKVEKEKSSGSAGEESKEKALGEASNGNGSEKPSEANFEILRRMNEDSGEGEDANGTIAEDKAVKPKEIVQEPSRAAKGSWRKAPEQPAETTAENLEEEGWSTVPQKSGKNRRGGNQAPRAIAS